MPDSKNSLMDLYGLGSPFGPTNASRNPFADLIPPSSGNGLLGPATDVGSQPRHGLLGGSFNPFGGGLLGSAPAPSSFGAGSTLTKPQIKRRAYFSFHYDDVMRVNNVRQAWLIDHPDSATMRSFSDSSLWESRKLESPEGIKNLIRSGLQNTSAVCVLVGSDTWCRRWVRYEIARAIVDGRGLLAVHINGLKHVQRQQPDPRGINPLSMIGVYRSRGGEFRLFDKRLVVTDSIVGKTEWQWLPYDDFRPAIRLPRFVQSPPAGHVVPLSSCTQEYDYVADYGHANVGAWIDEAARRASH